MRRSCQRLVLCCVQFPKPKHHEGDAGKPVAWSRKWEYAPDECRMELPIDRSCHLLELRIEAVIDPRMRCRCSLENPRETRIEAELTTFHRLQVSLSSCSTHSVSRCTCNVVAVGGLYEIVLLFKVNVDLLYTVPGVPEFLCECPRLLRLPLVAAVSILPVVASF